MTAHATIDWPGIRAAAVTLGIRAAARHAAANLPPEEQRRFVERVMKRASREGWEQARTALVSAPSAIQPAQAKPLSAIVRNGAETMQDALADDSRASRLALSRGLRKVAEHVADLDPAEALEQAQNVKATVGSLATVQGWDTHTAGVSVNVALLVQ